MALYRRLAGQPIEAVQWPYQNGNCIAEPEKWPQVHSDGNGCYYVETIHEQPIYLTKGDWILPEPDGKHFYPCKPDIFAKTYEPAYELDDLLKKMPPDDVAAARLEWERPGPIEFIPELSRPTMRLRTGGLGPNDPVGTVAGDEKVVMDHEGVDYRHIPDIRFDADDLGAKQIDTSDIPEASEEWFKKARLRVPADLAIVAPWAMAARDIASLFYSEGDLVDPKTLPERVRVELSLIEALRSDIARLNTEIERVTRRQHGELMGKG